MLNFWRLDTEDDFFLVAAPTWEMSQVVRAYHLELLNRVRSLEHHHLIEADAVLFSEFASYYQKISERLSPSFDVSTLTPPSRHSFFIASEARGDSPKFGVSFREAPPTEGASLTKFRSEETSLGKLLLLGSPQDHIFRSAPTSLWISGLEVLMGYEYEARGKKQEGRREESSLLPSTGEFELDMLSELLLLPNSSQVEWLTRTRSPTQLAALTKQISDRLRGQEAIDESQREKDLKVFEQQQGVEQLKKAGFSL